MPLKVTVKHWHAAASWTWNAGDDVCGICRMPFDGCPPGSKFPGDDSPVVWGTCGHAFHLQCISKWLQSDTDQVRRPARARPPRPARHPTHRPARDSVRSPPHRCASVSVSRCSAARSAARRGSSNWPARARMRTPTRRTPLWSQMAQTRRWILSRPDRDRAGRHAAVACVRSWCLGVTAVVSTIQSLSVSRFQNRGCH